MMKIFICLTILFLASGPVTGKDKVRWPRVLLLGDSLTQLSFSKDGAWGAMIADRVAKQADVMNRGFGGFTTQSYLNILNESLSGQDPKSIAAVTLLLGTNDANLNSPNHIPVANYSLNMSWLIYKMLRVHKIDMKKMILIAPPPNLNSRSNTTGYAEAVVKKGKKLEITTVNLFPIFEDAIKKKVPVFVDGVHFNPTGSKMVFDAVWPAISKKLDQFARGG